MAAVFGVLVVAGSSRAVLGTAHGSVELEGTSYSYQVKLVEVADDVLAKQRDIPDIKAPVEQNVEALPSLVLTRITSVKRREPAEAAVRAANAKIARVQAAVEQSQRQFEEAVERKDRAAIADIVYGQAMQGRPAVHHSLLP